MADTLAPILTTIAATVTQIATDLATLAQNLANNPNIPQADIDAANALATSAGALDTTVQGLVTQTGGAPGPSISK